jgi:hypothetical protein
LRREFGDLKEARNFADWNEATLGPLKVLDRESSEVV